jgi:hypothetical protein
MTVFMDYEGDKLPPEARDNLESAWDYYQNEQYAYAGKFLRRVMEDLD